jgi:hypothetical protein
MRRPPQGVRDGVVKLFGAKSTGSMLDEAEFTVVFFGG